MQKKQTNPPKFSTRASTIDDARDFFQQVTKQGDFAVRNSTGIGYNVTKRLCDVVLSLVALILLSPVFLLTAIVVFLASPGPVFFKQQRAGKAGKPFTMYKFRTMQVNAQASRDEIEDLNCQTGPVFKAPNDPRLIKLGKFLRRSSLDELPQFFNVLKGDMSIVGPRPLWIKEAKNIEGAAKFRTLVKPGLTCIWQISGRSSMSYEQWILLDLFYINNRSIMLDFLIVMQTIPAVLTGYGAF